MRDTSTATTSSDRQASRTRRGKHARTSTIPLCAALAFIARARWKHTTRPPARAGAPS
jgi:hypothetical protein